MNVCNVNKTNYDGLPIILIIQGKVYNVDNCTEVREDDTAHL